MWGVALCGDSAGLTGLNVSTLRKQSVRRARGTTTAACCPAVDDVDSGCFLSAHPSDSSQHLGPRKQRRFTVF